MAFVFPLHIIDSESIASSFSWRIIGNKYNMGFSQIIFIYELAKVMHIKFP